MIVEKVDTEQEMVLGTVDIIQGIQQAGFDTIAIICRTIEETIKVKELLKAHVKLEHLEDNIEEMTFTNGIMVLPIFMTKGLEFDSVIIWNPDENSYQTLYEDAKLLYVAITRALHELYIIFQGNLSGLLL